MQLQVFKESKFTDVVIMEDLTDTREKVVSILKRNGCRVRIATNSNEAIEYAKKTQVKSYILDINMGQTRTQEGLDALERLKKINSGNWVAILSGYPQKYKNMAIKLQADFFQEKTGNIESDLKNIMQSYCQYIKPKVYKGLCETNEMGNNNHKVKTIEDEIKSDINYNTYLHYYSNKTWRIQNEGLYIGIVLGKIEFTGNDKNALLAEIRRKYPNVACYFTQVKTEIEKYKIITPFFTKSIQG